MFKNLSKKDKRNLAIVAPVTFIAFVNMIVVHQVPFESFAFFWYNLQQVVMCGCLLAFIYSQYGKGAKKNEN